MMEAVICKNITKVYGRKKAVAVDHISFTVNKGELFGLIGPDGAGKTSIFRMLTTLLLPDGGGASVDGFDIVKDYKKIRKTVGACCTTKLRTTFEQVGIQNDFCCLISYAR